MIGQPNAGVVFGTFMGTYPQGWTSDVGTTECRQVSKVCGRSPMAPPVVLSSGSGRSPVPSRALDSARSVPHGLSASGGNSWFLSELQRGG